MIASIGIRSVLLALALGAATALADERILSFDSDITIAVDGSMQVTETIVVRAEGDQIRRGIFRDFPTDYRDRLGNRYRVGFDVLAVTRDGRAEPFFTERLSNGVRVYIGNADVLLAPGEYAYALSYHTTRQLGFFDDHDELYWNVTGNGWDFQIDRAAARVVLPEVPAAGGLTMEGYTGASGSREAAYAARVLDDGTARIETTRRLFPREGLTLVASWPKGIVTEPTAAERAVDLLSDNGGLLVALAGFAAALAYLIYAWRRVGRDPVPGVVFPHYTPPDGVSAAAMRYVSRMGYDNKAFTVAILSLAVKGFVEIEEARKRYTLTVTQRWRDLRGAASGGQGDSPLTHGERTLLDALFGGQRESVELDNENHAAVGAALRAHRRSLDRDYNRTYFKLNFVYVLPAALLIGIAFWIVYLMSQLTVSALLILVPAVATIPLFIILLRAPTPLGRRLLDKIEGFRLYLDVAEKDELALRNPPERTPELFEAYLPYALALGVEQAWAERFADVFERIQNTTGEPYRPYWYHGRWRSGFFGGPTRNLAAMTSSLNGAIAAASTPPGSSSGSGGGGSSGGGGGGGGGGGW